MQSLVPGWLTAVPMMPHVIERSLLALGLACCADAGPTLMVEHALGSGVWVRNVRVAGCVWPGVLGPGETTSPRECLSGEARVFYEAMTLGNPDWLAYATTDAPSASTGDELRVRLDPVHRVRDLTAPGPFGH